MTNVKTGIMSFHNRQSKLPVKPQVSFNKLNLEYIRDKISRYLHNGDKKMELPCTLVSKQIE